MLQRIQTIFLLVASFDAVFFFFSFFLNLFEINIFLTQSSLYFVLSIFATIAILGIINVFLFKNRSLQLKICYLLLFIDLFILIFLAKIVFFDKINVSQNIVSIVLLAVSSISVFVSLYLAKTFILKDITLVSESNRLR